VETCPRRRDPETPPEIVPPDDDPPEPATGRGVATGRVVGLVVLGAAGATGSSVVLASVLVFAVAGVPAYVIDASQPNPAVAATPAAAVRIVRSRSSSVASDRSRARTRVVGFMSAGCSRFLGVA